MIDERRVDATMGNEVPSSVPQVDSSKMPSMIVMSSRFPSNGLRQAAADENAHVNCGASSFHNDEQHGALKPAPSAIGATIRRRTSMGCIHPNNGTESMISRLPPLGQWHGHGSTPNSTAVVSTPTTSVSSNKVGEKRSSCTTSSAAASPSSFKRSRNRFSLHAPEPAISRSPRRSLPHWGTEGVNRLSMLPSDVSLSSASSSHCYGSSQVSVVREPIQTYPSHAPGSSRPPRRPPSPSLRQQRKETCQQAAVPSNSHSANNESPPVAVSTSPSLAFCATSPPSFDEIDAIREAVRAYTLIPKDERSSDCEPVKAIFYMTGYVLTSPNSPSPVSLGAVSDAGTHGLLGSPGVTTRAHKAEVLMKLGGEDMFRHLDACKIRDASRALQATQCRPEKDRGFYRYVHVPTGAIVSPHNYEARYLAALNETCTRQWQYWGDYFDRLSEHDDQLRKERHDAAAVRLQDTSSAAGTPDGESATPARLLALPSRDETSSDPDLAKAERELWDKIDAALEEYSHQVLVIQERRRRALQPSTGYAV